MQTGLSGNAFQYPTRRRVVSNFSAPRRSSSRRILRQLGVRHLPTHLEEREGTHEELLTDAMFLEDVEAILWLICSTFAR